MTAASVLVRFFEPFIRDAVTTTTGVLLRLEGDTREHDQVARAVVYEPRGSGTGIWLPLSATDEEVLQIAYDGYDLLQEDVISYLAEAEGVFGPWPRCPEPGHAHKLTVASRPDLPPEPWWVCPDPNGRAVARLGELEEPEASHRSGDSRRTRRRPCGPNRSR